MRILSVDDKTENLYLMESMLRGHGYEVVSAHNGTEALQKLEEQPVDLIISDILMPHMDGFQLCREVKKNDRLKKIPFVFYTATYTDKKDEVLALSLGASRFIIKPAEPDRFLEIISSVIQEQEEKGLPTPESDLDEKIYLKAYNQSLIHKLEDKLDQLGIANRKLQEALEEKDKEIAERILAEKALTLSEIKYRRLYDSMMDAVVAYDLDGRITECNQVYLDMLGYTYDEITRMTNQDLTPEKWLPIEDDIFRTQVLARGFSETYETEYRRKDGSIFPVEMRVFLLRDDGGKPYGMWGIVRDITKRRQAEEERNRLELHLARIQKIEAIGVLAGGIAHDFNNILSAIIGYAELIKVEMKKEEPVSAYVDQVLKAGARAKELVQQILTFSRQTKQKMKPVKLSLILKEALSLLKATLPSSIEIREDIRDSALVMSDPTQVHQIIMNLCTNAAYAMRDSGGTLEVSLQRMRIGDDPEYRELDIPPGFYSRMTITDTGHGMSPDVMKRIFEPYFTTKEPGHGTGLGLSVVYGIVRNHGGAVTCESTPGKGTTFMVYLPEFVSEGDALEGPGDDHAPTGSERILLVDDEQVLADLAVNVLKNLRYAVTARTSSREALELFSRDPSAFDLVITDMTMPGMMGDELAQKLLEIRRDVPIILYTGYNEHISPERAKEIGIKKYIAKPVERNELACAVREVLDRK
jgi:PAS domain S-box-containing protein